jgi:acetate kinase
MAAILGGLDALVFTGGIGENAAPISARAPSTAWPSSASTLDPKTNADQRPPHRRRARPDPRPMPTDEERVIARATAAALP